MIINEFFFKKSVKKLGKFGIYSYIYYVINERYMTYTNFDRHTNMSGETLSEIGSIIRETHFEGGFNLVNMLYGLYDGYLYEELLPLAKTKLETSLYQRIENVVNIVSKYPKI